MKSVVFDSGPLISLTLNNLLWLLEPLEKKFEGNFYITEEVKYELVEKPMKTKRFEFEALQVLHYIDRGILKVLEKKNNKTDRLLRLANNIFKAKGNFIQIVHAGEISSVAACLDLGSNILVVDERTVRLLIENPKKLKTILQDRLHTKVYKKQASLKKFSDMTKNIKIIRSVELATVAYELGLLDKYIPKIENGREKLLDSLLWALKLNGCSVSKREMEQILRMDK